MSDKIFEMELDEVNGEQEYSHYYVLNGVNNIDEAEKRALEIAKKYYIDENVEQDGDTFHFFGGQIAVTLGMVREMTKELWVESTMKRLSL